MSPPRSQTPEPPRLGLGMRHWLLHHERFGSVIGAVLVVLLGILCCNAFLGGPLIRASYDVPFILRGSHSPTNAVILYMDEESRNQLRLSWWQPWDRNLHARLLRRLKQEGAALVVFDVLLSRDISRDGPTPALDDRPPDSATTNLAAAVRELGRVVIASHLRLDEQKLDTGGVLRTTVMELPEEILLEAGARVGVAETLEDVDTVVRQLPLELAGLHETNEPTLDLVAARVGAAAGIGTAPPSSLGLWLNYYGEPGTIPGESYAAALEDLPAGYFQNKVVFVGEFYPATLPGVPSDSFRSPFSSGRARFHGVEIHATAVLNLLRGEWLRRWPGPVEFALVGLFGVITGAWLPRLRPLRVLAMAALLIGGIVAVACWAQWRAWYWFPWMIPAAVQTPAAAVWAIVWRAVRANVERQFLERSLSFYVSPKQVQRMLADPGCLRPGGVQQRISILASDIAGFSRIAGRMDAEDLLRLLNQYYDEAIECVHQTDGTVVKLIGDAIFAVWNAPQEQTDHQARAGRAALALQAKVVRFNSRLDTLPLVTRVGLHTGDACVGNVGSYTHFDYTAVGQAVNLAFRLEELNKLLGTNVLASRDFLKGLHDQFDSRTIGHFRLRGLDGVVEVHEILGLAQAGTAPGPWREHFTQGVRHFMRREFATAEAMFLETLALRPGDGPSTFLLGQARQRRELAVPRDWSGEIDLAPAPESP